MVVEWNQSYWGGSVALGGGALVLGALGRILREPRAYHGAVMALGMAVLANSRPYEGAILCSLVVGVFLWRLLTRQIPPSRLGATLAAFLAVLLLAGAAIGFYNFRVTGHPLRLPYQIHEAAYGVAPLFIWERPRPEPLYRHQVLRDFHVDIDSGSRQQRSLHGWLSTTRERYSFLAALHLPTAFRYLVLALLVLTIPVAVRKDSRFTLLLILLGGFVVGTLPEIFMSYRYTAPAASLLFLLVLRTLRHVRLWRWRGRPLGRSLVRVSVLACVVAFLVTTVRVLAATSEGLDLQQWGTNRAATIASLKHQDGRHLVIVRYGRKHSPHQEWVYNEADIDRSRVVWAREMDLIRNRALLEYFKDRHAWLLSVDDDAEAPHLVPYTERK
jgi:hypothetical protein